MQAWPYPLYIGHRGAGKIAPENTLAAMRVGAQYGYRMFEFDAKLSGDGTLILMHDDTLERTSNGVGRVAALGYGELMRLDAGSWQGSRFAGEPIPSLARILTWLQAHEFTANIEIKPCPGRERETGAAVALEVQALWKKGVVPLLSSFSQEAIEAAREAVPDLPRGLLLHEFKADWRERCAALGCVALHANQRWLDEQIIAQAHEAGLRVLTYTVNDPQRAQELIAAGLDGLITDAVDAISPGE
jgi:glycerophosphoryl diester phosphodiesterase